MKKTISLVYTVVPNRLRSRRKDSMKVDVTEWFDEKPKEYELSNDLYLATESDLWAFFNTRNKVLNAFMQEIIAMNDPDLLDRFEYIWNENVGPTFVYMLRGQKFRSQDYKEDE